MTKTFTADEIRNAANAAGGTKEQHDAFLASLGIEPEVEISHTYTVTITGPLYKNDGGAFPDTIRAALVRGLNAYDAHYSENDGVTLDISVDSSTIGSYVARGNATLRKTEKVTY